MAKTRRQGSGPLPDGRLQRSERSREAIVQALLDLVGEGVLMPTAEQVADRAGVGIRTVFRHFSDMDRLFAAMDARLQTQALPLLRAFPPEGGLPERLRGLVRRRAAFFEKILPYKRAGSRLRWRSEYLRAQHAAMVRALRADLASWLPELKGAPADLADAFELATSFEAWDRLRSEQRLGHARALAAMERAAIALGREFSGS